MTTGKGKLKIQKAKLEEFVDKQADRIINDDIGTSLSKSLSVIKTRALTKNENFNKELLSNIFKLAEEVAMQVCSTREDGESRDPSSDSLKEQLLVQFKVWDNYWKWLKPLTPVINQHLSPSDVQVTEGELVSVKTEPSSD